MSINRKEFDELICSLGTPAAEWDVRLRLLRYYDYMHDRVVEAEADRNSAQLKVEELRENFKKQNEEVRGLRANVSYGNEKFERAEATWIREANLLREALSKATDAAIQAEAKAEKYYRKARELEIALRLNCKMEPPTTKEIKEDFSQLPPPTEPTDIIDEIGPDPTTITWKQVMRLHGRAVDMRETCAEWERQYNHRQELDDNELDQMTADYIRVRDISHEFEDKCIRLQSLLSSAVAQADATYAPYRKMVMDARAETDKVALELYALKENMRKQPGAVAEEYCEWEYANGDEDNASGYDAACGFTWGALDDTLIHDMIFCPHCGKRIRRDADDTVGV